MHTPGLGQARGGARLACGPQAAAAGRAEGRWPGGSARRRLGFAALGNANARMRATSAGEDAGWAAWAPRAGLGRAARWAAGAGQLGTPLGHAKRGESGVGLGRGMGRQAVGGGLGWAARWRWAAGRPWEGRGKEAGRATEHAV
jgi:hypothetical protein